MQTETEAEAKDKSIQTLKDQKNQLFKEANRLMVDFKDQNFYTLLEFSKKAHLDTQIILQQSLELPNYDVSVIYECDKGIYKDIILSEDIEKIINQSVSELTLELDLKDDADVPMFKLSIKLSQTYSTIEKSLLNGTVKQNTLTNYLMSFSDVQIQNPEKVRRTQQTNEIKKSEVIMVIEVEKQRVEIDIDNPRGTDKKNIANQFMMFKNGEKIKIRLEERIYKLERDEQAFLQSIRQINTKQTTSINQFLMQKTGGFGVEPSDFNSIVNRKKVFQEAIPICSKEISIEHDLINGETEFSLAQKFSIFIDMNIFISGNFTLFVNKFANVPRGKLKLEIVDYTCFKKDQNIEYQDLVVRASAQVDKEGDRMSYLIRESDFLSKRELQQEILFDTFYFDDVIKIELFHKNSIIKTNNLGKGVISLHSVAYDDNSVVPINIYSKALQRNLGILYVKLSYQQLSIDLFDDEWLIDLQDVNTIDKYAYFDQYLFNAFKNHCSFGYLQVDLSKVFIPESAANYPGNNTNAQNEKTDQKLFNITIYDDNENPQLFMLKIKIGNESIQMYLGIPNQVFNPNNQNFFARTSSINDKMSIEFYHIKADKDFDPDAKHDFQNMRLLSHEQLYLRNLPFNDENSVINYQLLMSIQNSGSVACFDLNIHFQPQIEGSLINKPVNKMNGGLLSLKMVQNEDQSNNHHKDLEKYSFLLEIINETKKISLSKKLYFNKVVFPLGFIEMSIKDQIKFCFSVVKGGSSNKEEIVTYCYEVTNDGLRGVSENCIKEIIYLSTWRPLQKPFNLSYTHDGFTTFQFGKSTLAQQLTQGGGGTNPQMKQTDMNIFKSTTKGFNNTTQTMQGGRITSSDKPGMFLIDQIMLELEYRENYLSELSSRKQIETSIVNIYLQKENIVDLLISRDMTDNAQFEVSNVSSDKRCLRDIHSFYINAFDFEPMTMRLFTINDVIQLKIRDTKEIFTSFKLAELPLYAEMSMIYFFQVGTKQMQVKIEMVQDLVPAQEQQSAGGGLLGKLMKNMELGVKNVVQAEKEANEYMKKLNEIGGKSAAEQIKLLKQYVNDQEQQNKQLITKQLRLMKEYEKTQKKLAQAQVAKPKAPDPNIAKDSNISEITKMLSGVIQTKSEQGSSKNSNQQPEVKRCGCGELNPKFKGYCQQCVTRLKTAFDHYLEKFKKVSEEYDSYTGIDQKKADEKIRLMKNKIDQYELKLNETELIDVIEKHSLLAQSDENRNFAEFKVTVQSMKQELEIMKVKQDIELQDLKKQQDYLEMMVAKKQGSKKDIERENEQLQDHVEEMGKQIDDIEKRVALKKRYVLQQTKRII